MWFDLTTRIHELWWYVFFFFYVCVCMCVSFAWVCVRVEHTCVFVYTVQTHSHCSVYLCVALQNDLYTVITFLTLSLFMTVLHLNPHIHRHIFKCRIACTHTRTRKKNTHTHTDTHCTMCILLAKQFKTCMKTIAIFDFSSLLLHYLLACFIACSTHTMRKSIVRHTWQEMALTYLNFKIQNNLIPIQSITAV